MTDSFRRIDYSIRPAKYAERKMLCDIFRRLASFDPAEAYRYVGFGSVWFSDFLLFHRALGVRDMLSIEQASRSKDRFLANRPFNIDIDFRSSTAVLPGLDYTGRQFIWLDYDDPITPSMLQDVSTIASRASSGTVLVISVQCHRAPDVAQADKDIAADPTALSAEARFLTRFAGYGVDPSITREDLMGWSFGDLSRNLVFEEVRKALEIRRLADPGSAVQCSRICDIEYEDGAKMTTIALVFHSEAEAAKLEACQFDQLEFLDGSGDPVYIPTPKLTVREFRHLESQLPLRAGAELDIGFIPAGEAKGFINMYRYFPNFAVVES